MVDLRFCKYHDDGVGRHLPRTEFYPSQSTRQCCRACFRTHRKTRYDIVGQTDVSRYGSLVRSAVKRGITCDLSLNQFQRIISQPCAYSERWTKAIQSGVDRINSSIGYTLANCVPCCAMHNLFKSNFLTLEQAKDAVKRYGIPCGNSLGGKRKTPRSATDGA